MMNKYIIALAAVAGLTAAGCSSEMPDDNAGENYGILSTKSITCVIANKDLSRTVDTSNFVVEILEGEDLIEKYDYGDMPEVITLKTGNYNVKAYSPEPTDQDHGEPYYFGEKDFKIEANKITEVDNITCTLQNIMVTVHFSEKLKEIISDDAKVKVSYNNTERSLKKEEIATIHGDTETCTSTPVYFTPGTSTDITAELTGYINGKEIRIHKTFGDNEINRGDNHIIKFSVKNSEGE